jgi:LmbE family N-acetylglucosaminyl deacetylase
MRRWACLSLLVSLSALTTAQMRVAPLDQEQGHVALGLALRRLGNIGIFMHATAHPDDENNGLLVLLSRGLGFRTALATATRGDGGQNEIGPEIFEALGVLRTEELAAMHRFDGAEQYFTRAVDFGFSFSLEETFEKWGREEITGDFVRLIRTIRPDVMLTLRPDGEGGGQHHQASAILAREAFKLAGDPTKYPEQLKAGLRPWQPKKLYFPAQGFGGRGVPPAPAGAPAAIAINLAGYDSLIGRTYSEIGTEARSMHKCQGMGQLLSLPGPSSTVLQLVESALPGGLTRPDRNLYDGVEYAIAGLAQFAGARPPRELTNGLAAISSAVLDAQKRFDAAGAGGDNAAMLQPLLNGLRATRELRAQLRTMTVPDDGRFEIEFRLRQKEREFQQAILLANGVRIEALADDGVVVPGQPVRLSVVLANRGATPLNVRDVSFEGLSGDARCTLTAPVAAGGRGGQANAAPPGGGPPLSALAKDQVGRCDVSLTVPADTRITEPYWQRQGEAGRYVFDDDAPFGLPYRPTPFYVQATLSLGPNTSEVFAALPVQYRYQGDNFSGEKRSTLLVVPALAVRVTPEVAIVPFTAPAPAAPAPQPTTGRGRGRGAAPARPPAAGRGRGAAPAAPAPPAPDPTEVREVRVTVVNDTKGEIDSVVALDIPEGWTSTPAEQKLTFTREDESQTVRFQLRGPRSATIGEYTVGARATAGQATYNRGFQVIEYPHTTRQHIFRPAATRLKVLDVKTTPNLTVGYVMGAGDEVPAALAQLGARVELLQPDDLAWSDLSRLPVIVTGVRAYEKRADLRANNARLLDYVRAGGRLIVQYNKLEFNEAQYGPHSAKVTNDRVTDETSPVTVLEPADPLMTTPNRITDSAWQGWVQERGLYFMSEHDSRYRDLLELEDPFPNNAGPKRGALVAANYGKGRWIYVGLALWRELPAGVDGAYQILANLISPK